MPLRIVLPSEPADIDACNMTVSNIGIIIKENVVETLTTLNAENSAVQPRLATASTDQGNGTWRVTLRDGVTSTMAPPSMLPPSPTRSPGCKARPSPAATAPRSAASP